jgi:AcrR family transcriptional regulator
MGSAEDTNTRILDAALELFYVNGYDGTTTRAIAEGARVNEVTLFRNFGTKKNIFMAAVRRETDVSIELEGFDLHPTGDLEDDLAKAGERMHHEMVSRAKLMKIVMVEATRDPDVVLQVAQAPFQVLAKYTEYFREAKDKGQIRDVDPELASVAFFSFFFRSMISTAFLGRDVFLKMGQGNIREFAGIIARGLSPEVA